MSQETRIESYLLNGGKLTAIKALRLFQCFRLASRVSSLKRKGMRIKSEIVTRKGKRFSEYRMS